MQDLTISHAALKRKQVVHAWMSALAPVFGVTMGVIWSVTHTPTSTDFVMFIVMYSLTTLGTTIGYHRLFAHRAFDTSPSVQYLLAILGSMTFQGSLLYWVSTHRLHHQYPDREGDPHSPMGYGTGFINRWRGFWHGHIGWIFSSDPPNPARLSRDLLKDPWLLKISAHYYDWVALGIMLPGLIGGLITWSWLGVLNGIIYGGIVRISVQVHFAYAINSVCHLFGSRHFDTPDNSRNNILLVLPTFGEGWHNNHHACPSAATFGVRWWEIDIAYYVILLLELLGLAWDIHPHRQTVEEPA